jgi:YbgC/YbaW family acyl-CoA thioester hydrolase
MNLSTTLRVRTYELDSFGHVNNAAYLNYLEEARSEFLKQMGLSFHDFARLGVQLVIVEAHLQYIRPARYGDEIVVQGEVHEVKSASVLLGYTLLHTQTGETVATATTKGAFVDAATGKPIRAPELFRTTFLSYLCSHPIPSPSFG